MPCTAAAALIDQMLQRKACPSLVPIVGACAKTGGHMVLFMELLPGKTLLDFVYDMMEDKPIMRSAFFTPGGTRRGEYSCVPDSLPWDLKWQLAEAVVRAVAALHASGLVHRDLKPKNIIVDVLQDADGSWRVKVGARGRGGGGEGEHACIYWDSMHLRCMLGCTVCLAVLRQ